MPEAYRESSYYEGGVMRIREYRLHCPGIRAANNVQTQLQNLAKRELIGGVPTPVEVQSLPQHADLKSDQPMFRDLAPGKWSTRRSDSPYLRRRS
jgi:hypothetical protein